LKIRNGFVSNSSSSSFVCDVCRDAETGYDMSLSDIDWMSCENGHVICKDCLRPDTLGDIQERQEEKAREEIQEKYSDWTEEELEEEGIDFENDVDEILVNLDGLSADFCPICLLEMITDETLVSYLLKMFEIDRSMMKDRIRATYKNLSELQRKL